MYRRFLPHNDIDRLLAYNTSAQSHAPLTLHTDLDLVRPNYPEDDVIHILLPNATNPYVIDMPSLHSAFRDGFALRVYHMEKRTRVLADLVEGLRNYWMVDVNAHIEMDAKGRSNKAQIRCYANDLYLIQLESSQTVVIYQDLFSFPAQRHLNDHTIIQTTREEALRAKKSTIHLEEGDLLYIPRGWGFRLQPKDVVSLHVMLNVATWQSSMADAIISTIRAVRDPHQENPLDISLQTRGGIEYDADWADVLESAIAVAAELIPSLRRFVPVGVGVEEDMEEVDHEDVIANVAEEVRKFAEAAGTEMLKPIIEILVEEEEQDKLAQIASHVVVDWMKKVVEDGDIPKMEQMFRVCLRAMASKHLYAQWGVQQLRLTRYEKEKKERSDRLKWREWVLERHGSRLNTSKEMKEEL